MKFLLDRLFHLPRIRFVRNFATLSLGQGISALVPILAAPILGRLYLPADYGILGSYMALGVVLGTLSNLQYFKGIIVDKHDEEAAATLALALRVAFGTSALVLVGVALAYLLLPGGSAIDALWPWLWFLPLTVLVSGNATTLQALANRENRYRFMSRYQIVNIVITVSASILFGFLKWGSTGLMAAYFMGQIGAFAYLVNGNRAALRTARATSPGQRRAAAIRHRKFAIWSTPTSVVEQAAMMAPVYVLGLQAGMLALVGHFNRARGLLAMPVQLFAQAIGQVFFRRGAEEIGHYGSCSHLFVRLAIGLTAIGIPLFTLLYLIAPTLFVFVLGPNWHETGEVARILAPVIGLQFITMPLTKILWLHGYQRLDFWMSSFFAATTAGATALSIWLHAEPIGAIIAYAVAQGLMYVTFLGTAFLIAYRHRRTSRESAAT